MSDEAGHGMMVRMTTHTATPPAFTPIPPAFALVCLPSEDERRFAYLEGEIRLRQLHIERLEAEIAPLDKALDAFEWDYKARVGTLQNELRTLHDLIQRIEHRTARIHARLVADPEGILGDVFSPQELVEIGEMFGIDIPPSWFAPDEGEERQREREWRFYDDEVRQEWAEREASRRERRASRRPEPSQDLRNLYRSLARLCHPDLATDEADRSRRQELMRRINAAWHAQDLGALREIEQDRIGTLGWRALKNWAERLLWARREVARLDARIIALTERLQALRNSDTFPLWFNPTLGNSVITNRVTTLRIDIANAQHRLDQVKDAFRQALHHYAATAA
jgi:hypothetical protein